jgi:exonuclease VII small subunit
MAKLIAPADFGKHLIKKQGDLSSTEFEKKTGVARQILHRLKNGYLPTPDVLKKLKMGMAYFDLPDKKA